MSKDGERALARPVSFRHHAILPATLRMVLLQSVCKVSVGSDFDIHKQFHVQKVLSMEDTL